MTGLIPDWLALFRLPRGHGDTGFGDSGTLIRHAFRGVAASIGALMVAMVESSCGALLVASVGFAELAAACQVATGPAAVALSPVTMAADVENLAALRAVAGSSTENEFQGSSRLFPKAGLDNGPRAVAGLVRLCMWELCRALGTGP